MIAIAKLDATMTDIVCMTFVSVSSKEKSMSIVLKRKEFGRSLNNDL
jgi:hypothetical protein